MAPARNTLLIPDAACGNLALSQARAEAVLIALQFRRLPVEGFVANGYGEANPVADNGTEAGREANRRIEFALIGGPAPKAAKPAVAAPASGTGTKDDAARPRSETTLSTAGDPSLTVAAAAPATPELGVTRSITLTLEPEVTFAPTDETTLRPRRRADP